VNAEGAVHRMHVSEAAEKTPEKAGSNIVIASESAPLRDTDVNIGLIDAVESRGLVSARQTGRQHARHVALRRLRRSRR
jgi:hypothetical protein